MKKILLILILFLYSCEIFVTREPETPDTGASSFVPPTSPEIVVFNLQNSILEKNAENYIACFTDSVPYLKKSFVFIPASEANTKYPNLFYSWNLNSERQYFISLISTIPNEISPQVNFLNGSFDLLSTDSALYVSNYNINANHSSQNVPKIFSGKLVFTLFPNDNGIWAIGSWNDFSNENDSIDFTWSNLKALFGS